MNLGYSFILNSSTLTLEPEHDLVNADYEDQSINSTEIPISFVSQIGCDTSFSDILTAQTDHNPTSLISTEIERNLPSETEKASKDSNIFVIKKPRGRHTTKRKNKLTEELQYKSKIRSDNVATKIKVHFFQFLFDYVNVALRKYSVK